MNKDPKNTYNNDDGEKEQQILVKIAKKRKVQEKGRKR